MGDFVTASLASLGAVIGLIGGGVLGGLLGADVGPNSLIPVVLGALAGAFLCAWIGVRLAGVLSSRTDGAR